MKPYSVFFASYTVGTDVYKEVPEICDRFGSRILLIGGEHALAAGKEKLVLALEGSGMELVGTELYGNDCTYKKMEELAALAKQSGAEMIFGMGGGKAIDTARNCRKSRTSHLYIFNHRVHLCCNYGTFRGLGGWKF